MDQVWCLFLKRGNSDDKQNEHLVIGWKSNSQLVSKMVYRTVKELLVKTTDVIFRSNIFLRKIRL